MKTKYTYIEFRKSSLITNRTIWDVYNHKYCEILGFLEYNSKWGEWQFVPSDGTAYTLMCLEDLAHFIKQLKYAH